MEFYFAPLEGVTGYIFRNAYYQCFEGRDIAYVDKFFSPFISPGNHKKLTTKEQKDVAPSNNQGIALIPQILTNDVTSFIRTAKHLEELGYDEVNLNLGCPSGTVVAKGKGAGFLEDVYALERFFDDVFSGQPLKISVKTRIGLEEKDEFIPLMQMFNQFPFTELIIHPRLRIDYYGNHPDLETFAYALEQARMPVCYNGDIFTLEDYEDFTKRFPTVDKVMLGRGALANPALFRKLQGGKDMTEQEFSDMHEWILNAYAEEMSGDRNLLFKMKELWNYWICMFDEPKQHMRKIRKANTKSEYGIVISNMLRSGAFHGEYGYRPQAIK